MDWHSEIEEDLQKDDSPEDPPSEEVEDVPLVEAEKDKPIKKRDEVQNQREYDALSDVEKEDYGI